MSFRQRPSGFRLSLALLLIHFCIQSCAGDRSSRFQKITQLERKICMGRTSDISGNADIARRDLAQCLKEVRSKKLDLNQNDIVAPPAPERSLLSGLEQYKYCILHQDEVKEAYDKYTGANSRLLVLERELGPTNARTEYVVAEAQEAESILRRLLPVNITGGMSLVPEAARKFSSCNRSDF